ALPGPVDQPAEQVELLVGDVLVHEDPKLAALDTLQERVQGGVPRGRRPPDGGHSHALGRVDVRVLEASPVADPALVDVVVLPRGHADQLVAALPEADVAAD